MHEILTPHLGKDLMTETGDISALTLACQKCLHVYPPVRVKIHICKTDLEVQRKYREFFGTENTYRAFVRRSNGTIYISIQKRWFSVPLQEVLAHEIAHVLIEAHFGPKITPPTMHELMAQYCQKNYRSHI